MTRFARARGSKSSNKREPEEATPWHIMKINLKEKGNIQSQDITQEPLLLPTKTYIDNSAEHYSEWADFSDEEKTNKKKSSLKNMSRFKKKNKSKQHVKLKNMAKSADISNQNTHSKSRILKKIKESLNGEFLEKSVINYKSKQRSTEENEESVDGTYSSDCVNKFFKLNRKKQNRNFDNEDNKKVKNQNSNQSDTKTNSSNHLVKVSIKKKQKKNKQELNHNTVKFKSEIQRDKVHTKTKNKWKPKKPKIEECVIGGKSISLMYIDGFPIRKEDGERLLQLRKDMQNKGIPKSEIDKALKLERRRAEKALAREKKKRCFNCRGVGHVLSECPNLPEDNVESTVMGICFKCGSTEHTHFQCKVVRGDSYKFAQCFICKEQGHIARQCPDNAKGLYPQGGACKVCGDVTHLKKDCPTYINQQEEHKLQADIIDNKNIESIDIKKENFPVKNIKKQKVVKF